MPRPREHALVMRRRAILLAGVLVFAARAVAVAQTPVSGVPAPAAETRTAHYFESIRHDPVRSLLFLRELPKGGDLHSHLSGAIYAETYIRWAAQDGMCVELRTGAFVRPPCDTLAARPPAERALRDDALHDLIIDALSMRNWQPSRNSGHSQFFDSFEKFRVVAGAGRMGDMLAEASARAARGRVSYLELMVSPGTADALAVAQRIGWNPDLAALRAQLLARGFSEVIAAARRAIDAAETRQRELLACTSPRADPGCGVTVRYQYQVARARAPELVFAQLLAAFEVAAADHRVVALNLVQPEDHPIAMQDFPLHMRMIDTLRRSYPDVRVTLHAGELAPGLVPPEGLRFHIRASIDAGATRIGHGVAIAHEDGADELLARMARDRILVEVALSSNDAILGVRGADHPLALYLRHGVPVALVTDDEGVLRSDLTHEFLRAVREHGLDYTTLKQLARNSLAYAFVDDVTKARLLQQLERDFAAFEQKYGTL